jgi:hypothetical protein
VDETQWYYCMNLVFINHNGINKELQQPVVTVTNLVATSCSGIIPFEHNCKGKIRTPEHHEMRNKVSNCCLSIECAQRRVT